MDVKKFTTVGEYPNSFIAMILLLFIFKISYPSLFHHQFDVILFFINLQSQSHCGWDMGEASVRVGYVTSFYHGSHVIGER